MRHVPSILVAVALSVLGVALPASGDSKSKAIVLTTTDGSTLQVWRATNATLPGTRRPAVVIVPGWNCLPEDYDEVTAELAAHGLAVAIFEHGENSELSAATWDRWLAKATDRLVADASAPTGKTFGIVDPKSLGILGHSLGGAAAVLAAARDSRFKAVALFGPSARDMDFLDSAKKIKCAVLTIDGSLDRIAPPDDCSAVVAARASTAFTGELVIKDGNHPNCPADFDTDSIRDKGRWVMKPTLMWPFVEWTYDFPIVPDVKPMPAAQQRRVAFPYLSAWMERFLAGAKDEDGWTTGEKADEALKKGVLTRSRWSAGARQGN